MPYKKYLLLTFLLPFPFFLAFCILVFIYDPLQLYHKPYFRELTFSNDMRFTNKVMIDNYDFDSIVFGTSMLENMDPKEANQKLGGDFVNLSMGASDARERKIVFDYLLRKKDNLKQVLYSLDSTLLTSLELRDTKRFDFLYKDSIFTPFIAVKSYMNDKFLMCALSYSKKEKCVGKSKDIYNITQYQREPRWEKLFGGFENLIKHNKDPQVEKVIRKLANGDSMPFLPFDEVIDISGNQDSLTRYFIPLIQENPQIQFHIIIPTYSKLNYRAQGSKDFYHWAKSLQWLVTYCAQFDNVKFYGFDLLDYADDIGNYHDLAHYHLSFNSFQLQAIANQTFILNKDNIKDYTKEMAEKIKAYDVTPLIEIAKQKDKLR